MSEYFEFSVSGLYRLCQWSLQPESLGWNLGDNVWVKIISRASIIFCFHGHAYRENELLALATAELTIFRNQLFHCMFTNSLPRSRFGALGWDCNPSTLKNDWVGGRKITNGFLPWIIKLEHSRIRKGTYSVTGTIGVLTPSWTALLLSEIFIYNKWTKMQHKGKGCSISMSFGTFSLVETVPGSLNTNVCECQEPI